MVSLIRIHCFQTIQYQSKEFAMCTSSDFITSNKVAIGSHNGNNSGKALKNVIIELWILNEALITHCKKMWITLENLRKIVRGYASF